MMLASSPGIRQMWTVNEVAVAGGRNPVNAPVLASANISKSVDVILKSVPTVLVVLLVKGMRPTPIMWEPDVLTMVAVINTI